jgi:hypothetical protein
VLEVAFHPEGRRFDYGLPRVLVEFSVAAPVGPTGLSRDRHNSVATAAQGAVLLVAESRCGLPPMVPVRRAGRSFPPVWATDLGSTEGSTEVS